MKSESETMSGKISFSQDTVKDPLDRFTVLNYNVRNFKPEDYVLSISGDVDTPKDISLAELQAMEQVTRKATKMCGTNSNAGSMIYNAEYTGVDLTTLLKSLGLKKGANSTFASSYDGWGFPIALSLMEENKAILILKVNGEDLEPVKGYPVTLGIPGQGGFVWVKYLKSIAISTVTEDKIPKPLPIMYPVNSGFLKPPKDGTETSSPAHIEGWAFCSYQGTLTKLLLSADYGKTWNEYPFPAGMDPAQWIYWKIDWTPPGAGTYLLKVKAQSGDNVQEKEDNVIIKVTG
jgi:DMSO/TMAO reductase YedYZ molybdopterin-dependent catalytic subunit